MSVLRTVAGLAGIVLVVWLAVTVLAALFQRQLIYLPDRSSPEAPPGVEEVALETEDGLTLTAWLVAPEDPVSTVLVAPGNAGNRAARLPLADGLAERGHGVLLLDYRGYGGNPGRPSEDGLRRDALAAHDHLAERDDVGVVALLGESLGSGVVAAVAAQRPVAAVALRSPFVELADVGAEAFPVLPVRLMLRDRFPVVEPLRRADAEVLVVAGQRDTIVAPHHSQQVAEALGAELVIVPGAGHNDRALLDGQVYLDAVDRFLREAVARP